MIKNHDYRLARKKMVQSQIAGRGIKDQRVLSVMEKVPRHLFIEEGLLGEAYNDHPLPIGHKQTISQPYIVALMTEALELTGTEKTLEIGTGSGYQTAILSELSKSVFTVERIKALFENARKILDREGYTNIFFKAYDGTLGWKEYAPYDAIIVTAGSPKPPQPLIDQLAEGGKMVIPVDVAFGQDLILLVKKGGKVERKSIIPVRFVPMTKEDGTEY